MSRVFLAVACLAAGWACAARDDGGLEVVRLPESAYLAPDAAMIDAAQPEAPRRDGGLPLAKMPARCFAPPTVPPLAVDAAPHHRECEALRGPSPFDPARSAVVSVKSGPACCYSVVVEVE